VRCYTVTTVAVTLKVPPKWVDNVLSHYRVPGVSQARQGVARRVTPQGVLILEIALRLSRSLDTPIHRALQVAADISRIGGSEARVTLTPVATLIMNVAAIEAETMARLAEAVEFAPVPRRGRPPAK